MGCESQGKMMTADSLYTGSIDYELAVGSFMSKENRRARLLIHASCSWVLEYVYIILQTRKGKRYFFQESITLIIISHSFGKPSHDIISTVFNRSINQFKARLRNAVPTTQFTNSAFCVNIPSCS